jgi:hypothetical protein
MNDEDREYNINGLSHEEVQMLEMMWSIESVEDMEDWMASLNREERLMVYRLRILLIAEIADYDLVQDLTIAREYLKKFQLNNK